MSVLRRLNLAEQAALHMQREIEAGRWRGRLPAMAQLAEELGMSKVKIQEALALVEARGLIVTQGSARHREIAPNKIKLGLRRSLRVGILLQEDIADAEPMMQELMLSLKNELEALGHAIVYAPKSQIAHGGDVSRICRMVEQQQADAWVVCHGSAPLLEWFRKQQTPFIALNGALDHSPMAAASLLPGKAFREVVQQLITLGHKRIVWVCEPHWIRPAPVQAVCDFQEQLHSSGLPAGDYNTPYYDGTPEGFQLLLHSLFQVTPPSVMIVPCQNHAMAVMGFLSRRGLSVPRDVSLISSSPGPALRWLSPKLSHFRYDPNFLCRRIVRWVEGCAKGMPDQDRESVEATFVDWESIARPPGR